MEGTRNAAVLKKLIDNLQTDFRSLSSDCKRKYPPVKEASEASLLRLRTIYTNKHEDLLKSMQYGSVELVQPFVMGCDTKNPKIVHHCLAGMQRLISHNIVNTAAAESILTALWVSMEAGVEELKLLQTAILLITTTDTVQHQALAKAIVLCFRLHFTKDSTTINTAAATVRQLVSMVFERVMAEDHTATTAQPQPHSGDESTTATTNPLKTPKKEPPQTLRPCAQDAYMLFQDLCQLVNADQPLWLVGMTEMTRTFGLELMESVLTSFPDVFLKHIEFSFLLKERVCPLVIKLFSPSLKYRSGAPASASPSPMDKPYFPIVMRLLRIVSVLIKHYYALLVTECEIFLSLLVKFLDGEKPMWQRAAALEVLSRLTAQPHLLHSFCHSYDMKAHSTKIFQDIVNGLGSFIQSQFVSPTTQSLPTGQKVEVGGTPPALVGGMPVGGGITPQPAFFYRNIWIPLVVNIAAKQGSHKPVFLEMLDKIEPPVIPDGYGLSLAFLCMLDVVKCVHSLIETRAAKDAPPHAPADGEEKDAQSQGGDTGRAVDMALIDSSWCGVLAALSILLDASSDESATEAILKAKQTYATVCGSLALTTPRDAFITALCKASLPPHYTLTILNPTHTHGAAATPAAAQYSRLPSTEVGGVGAGEMIAGSQVVAVGTPLAAAGLPLGAQSGAVMLTAKNIQCMRALLSMAHCHGSVLGTAWHQILTTLQHLVWILGLKPSSGGSLRAQASDNPNAVITTAVMADLPVLSSMLSRLFESSQYLDDVALHHLIDALCKLSTEAMELGFNNKDASLFAVAKLLETGLVNLPRVEVLWKPVTNHLLEVCQHPQLSLRAWGAEALTSLIKAALVHKHNPPLQENMRLQEALLAPLGELSGLTHTDIRQKQLECTLQILHNNGEMLGQGWPLILDVIGALTENHGEALVRTAFQCLQLVVADYLPIMPCACLQISVNVAASFGLQNQELNISLTAIGLIWNISDYFYQKREEIVRALAEEVGEGGQGAMPPFDGLWMCLFGKLGELCVDSRPAVRKSAGQTLFSTIAAHGTLLHHNTWQTVLWKVLFPLLEHVKKASSCASGDNEAGRSGGNILIHHSRDTAQKQWAETSVLSLAGVARVFNTKRKILQHLGDFPRAWALLLEFIESSALCQNAEVALASLKSFHEILQLNKDPKGGSDELKLLFLTNAGEDLKVPQEESMLRSEAAVGGGELTDADCDVDAAALWAAAWRVWLNIGTTVTMPPDSLPATAPGDLYIPSQPFLTALVETFPALYAHMKARFVAGDLTKLFTVLRCALAVPVHSDSTPFIMPVGDVALTPLQDAILSAVKVLHAEVMSGGAESIQSMCPYLFEQMLKFVEFAVKPPKFGKVDTKSVTAVKATQADWVAMNYVPFAEGVVMLVVELYAATATHPAVIQHTVLHTIIQAFHLPLSLKYACPSQSTWMLVINCLLQVLTIGLPIATRPEHKAAFKSMWIELGQTLEDFLFSQHAAPPTLSVEDFQRDEAIDCKVVCVLRDDMLPHSVNMPHDFVTKVMAILNKGSIHSATSSAAFIDVDSSRKLREEFAKTCFETLLQFSFMEDGGSVKVAGEGAITRLAVTALLKRCKDVLEKYVEDERLSGKCPLPRPRMSEMAFVLKAVSTLLVTLKRAPPANVEAGIWEQVIGLYPALVECTTSTSSQVCKALREALAEYRSLLAPPTHILNGT